MGKRTPQQLQVDWPRCRARGLCHELLPEAIGLDPWGYPIVDDDLPADLIELAREAVRICPVSALRLRATDVDHQQGGVRVSQGTASST